MKKIVTIVIFMVSLLNASILTENQNIEEISVSAPTKAKAKTKAMEEAIIQALKNFEIEDGVLQEKILTQYKLNKYFLSSTKNSLEKTDDGFEAIYSFEVSGSKLYKDLQRVISSVMKKNLGNDKIMTAFLMKSDDNIYDKSSVKKMSDANNKKLNSSIKKALKKLKIKTKDENGLKEILNRISKESVKLSTAEAQNKFEADVIRLAKKKNYKYVLVGVVNILDKRNISGNVGLNADIIGKVINLKNDSEEMVILSTTRKIMGADTKDAVLNLAGVIGDEIVATQMISQMINAFNNKNKIKRVDVYICKSSMFEDDYDDFKGLVLDTLDEVGESRDESESKRSEKFTYDIDMEKLKQQNSKIKKIRHIGGKYLKAIIKEDYEDSKVTVKGDRISLSLDKSVKCLPKKKKGNNKGKEVTAEGYGDSAKIARQSALQAALEQVMGANISSSTLVKQGRLASDDISSTTAGLISSYKILDTSKDEDGFVVNIKAVIDENAITESGIRDFINNKRSMQTFLSHNFKNRKLKIVYPSDKVFKKIFGNKYSASALSKKSPAVNEIISTIRKNLSAKGFKFTNDKSKIDTKLYVYATGDYSKEDNGVNVSLNLMLKGQDVKTKNIIIDQTKDVQAFGESKQRAVSQAARKAADAMSLEFTYTIVNNFINN